MIIKILISFAAFIIGVVAMVFVAAFLSCFMEKMRAKFIGVRFLGTVYKIGEILFIIFVALFFLAAGTSVAYDMIYGVK